MATVKRSRMALESVTIHEDEDAYDEQSEGATEEALDESRGPLEESGCTHSDDSDQEPDPSDVHLLDTIRKLENVIRIQKQPYRLMTKIGEGTFSYVFKAEDMCYDEYKNDWDLSNKENALVTSATKRQRRRPHVVAIKTIHATSSPQRVTNELELLSRLRGAPNVCPILTAFRSEDKIFVVLPCFQHDDFRDYFRDFNVSDMRAYMHSLFTAVDAVHDEGIIHRDIKPTNFLYRPSQRRGNLVDFGLAEQEGTDWHICVCQHSRDERRRRVQNSLYMTIRRKCGESGQPYVPSFPKEDSRPSVKANRAGTRGFRAPEVLVKCTAQSTIVDVWSCGVILLTFLSRRFPFFNSQDDLCALSELCQVFGTRRMQEMALGHGQALDTNIPTYTDYGHSWDKIVLWCNDRNKKDSPFSPEEQEAIDFTKECMELDANKRITAKQALQHPFLRANRGDGQITSRLYETEINRSSKRVKV